MKTLLPLLGVLLLTLGAAEDDIVSQLKRRDLTGDAAHLPAVSTQPSSTTTTTTTTTSSSPPKPSWSVATVDVSPEVIIPSTTTVPPQLYSSSSPVRPVAPPPATAETIVIKAEIPPFTTTPIPVSSSVAPATRAAVVTFELEKAPGLRVEQLKPEDKELAQPKTAVVAEEAVAKPEVINSEGGTSATDSPRVAIQSTEVSMPAPITPRPSEAPIPSVKAGFDIPVIKSEVTTAITTSSTPTSPIIPAVSSSVAPRKEVHVQSQLDLPTKASTSRSVVPLPSSTTTPQTITVSSSLPPQAMKAAEAMVSDPSPLQRAAQANQVIVNDIANEMVTSDLSRAATQGFPAGVAAPTLDAPPLNDVETVEWMAMEGFAPQHPGTVPKDTPVGGGEEAGSVEADSAIAHQERHPLDTVYGDDIYPGEWELPSPATLDGVAMSRDPANGSSVRVLEANAANYSLESEGIDSSLRFPAHGFQYPRVPYDGIEALNTMMEYIQWKGSLGQTLYYHPAARSLVERLLAAPIWAQIYALDLGMTNDLIANADAYAYSFFCKIMENFSWVLIILLATQVWTLSRRTKIMGERLVEAMRHQREENEKHAKNIMKYVEAQVRASEAQRQAATNTPPVGESPVLPGGNQQQWAPGGVFAPYTPDLNTCVQDLRLELENLRNHLLSELHVLKLGIEATFISQQEALVRSATIQDTFLKFYTSFTTFMVILTQECEGVLAVNENFQQVLCDEGVKMSQTLASKEFVRFLDIIDSERVGFGLLKASSPLFEDMRSIEAIRSFLEYLTASDYDDQVSTYGRSAAVPSEDVASPQGMTYSEPLTPPPGTHVETLPQV